MRYWDQTLKNTYLVWFDVRRNSDCWKSSAVSACTYTKAQTTSWHVSASECWSRNIWTSSIPNFRASLTTTRMKVGASIAIIQSSHSQGISLVRPSRRILLMVRKNWCIPVSSWVAWLLFFCRKKWKYTCRACYNKMMERSRVGEEELTKIT